MSVYVVGFHTGYLCRGRAVKNHRDATAYPDPSSALRAIEGLRKKFEKQNRPYLPCVMLYRVTRRKLIHCPANAKGELYEHEIWS